MVLLCNGIDSNVTENLFTTYKQDLLFTENDSLVLTESNTDKFGITHSTYYQLYKGIPVEGSMIVTHGIEKSVNKINGSYGKSLDLDINPTITEDEALGIGLSIIDAESYAWEDSLLEESLKSDLGNSEATYFPKGEIVIAKGYQMDDTIYNLAWKFDITTVNPNFQSFAIFINANDGSVIKLQDNSNYCDGIVGSGTTHYGTKDFDVREQGIFGGIYTLEDCDRGDGIHTKKYDGSGGVNWSNTDESHGYGADEPWWGSLETQSITAHWIIQEAYDCYLDNFDRTSFDGLGNRPLRIITESTGVTQSAYASGSGNPSYIVVGYHPVTSGSMARTDILGHEYTHLVINHELSYTNGNAEAAAMNEGLADIFGNYIEAYIVGAAYDYLLGEDVHTDRSMADPTIYYDPDTYLGTYWDGVTNNTGTNSGPLRKMFYLLANGGTHPVSNITVTSIGVEDAIQIMYTAIEGHYFTDNSTYADARTACINAAKDMFGDCSVQARQVTRAFAAIGVGSSIRNSAACVVIDAPPSYCEEDLNVFDIIFTSQYLPPTATVSWTVPSGWTYSLSGTGNSICTITHFNNASTQTITASVTSGAVTVSDNVVYDFEDCIPEGCPPLCKFESENINYLNSYKVYPNPAKDYLLIKSDNFKPNIHLTLFDGMGNKIKEGILDKEDYILYLHGIPSGLYYLNLSDSNENEFFKLFLE